MTSPRSHRLAAHEKVSAALARCSDRRLRELLAGASPVGGGIGGKTSRLEVEAHPVFVKQVRLSDRERQPELARSTADLFGLPPFCHYGIGLVGSPGFGAWRELAVHTMTTDWVVAGDHDGFPLTYHWRVLSDAGQPLPEELADVDRAVVHWGGDAAVRRRLEALEASSASVVLFLEHLPHQLHDWLGAQVRLGGERAERACAMVDRELGAGIDFLEARGLLHLDLHFENVLTDGTRLYLADYGLAVSEGFDLGGEEAEFVAEHRDYDRAYAATHLVNWLAVALYDVDPAQRRDLVTAWASGVVPDAAPGTIADLLLRHAPVAAVMGDFFRRFQRMGREAPYPRERIALALASARDGA